MAGGRAGLSQYFGGLPENMTLEDIDLPRRAPTPPPSSGGDGGSNAQKLPIGQYLDTKVFTRVSNLLQARSGRLPATLMMPANGDKTNTIWMVNFETDGTYTLPMVAVPIHTPEYSRPPYKQGDKGFVSTSDVDTTSMSNTNQQSAPANFGRPANLANLVWHPIGNTQFMPAIDPTAHETYGGPGGTITHDGTKKSQVRTHETNGSSLSAGGDGSGAEGPHAHTADNTGTTSKSTTASKIEAPNAQLDNAGNFHNTGNTSTNGAIMSATSVAAPSGNFASGSIGGMSMGGGILSGLMAAINTLTGAISGTSVSGTSGSFGSSDSGASAVADVVRARKYALLPNYTVAQLFAQLPPASTPAGARVFVVDIRNASAAFAAVLNTSSGGGSNGLCATCDGTNWKTG